MLTDRRYRLGVIRPMMLGGLVLFVPIWALALAEHAGVVFLFIDAFATVSALWQALGVLQKGGLSETQQGITNRRFVGYQQWRWEEIEKFTFGARSKRVFLITRDHHATSLIGVAEGRRVVWDDGETHAITSLLNGRLELRQAPSAQRPGSEPASGDRGAGRVDRPVNRNIEAER